LFWIFQISLHMAKKIISGHNRKSCYSWCKQRSIGDFNCHLVTDGFLCDVFVPGDLLLEGRRGLAILHLSNQARNGGIGGNKLVGNTDIYTMVRIMTTNCFGMNMNGCSFINCQKGSSFSHHVHAKRTRNSDFFFGVNCAFRVKNENWKDLSQISLFTLRMVNVECVNDQHRCLFRNHSCLHNTTCHGQHSIFDAKNKIPYVVTYDQIQELRHQIIKSRQLITWKEENWSKIIKFSLLAVCNCKQLLTLQTFLQ